MKTAIVTGATGNLGQAVIQKFLASGYHVTGSVRTGDTTTFDFPSANFKTITADLGNTTSAEEFVQSVIKEKNRVDAAVLTVGGFAMGKISDTSTSDIARQYSLNFETAYNVARPVFLQMIKQGYGRIFLIGSRRGLSMHNSKGMVAYGLGKSLLFNLAELMNEEAKGQNVVTSVIVPSTIDTPENRKSMPDADFNKWVKPGLIAEVIAFYCTDEAAIIKEPVIKVYGNS